MKRILIAILLLNVSYAYSQKEEKHKSIKEFIPHSPNVAAFTQYLSSPVNYYTGTPNIQFPLYTIKTGKLSYPITLSYHASGIKVGQMASNVGLGWQLSTNNVISRTVRGFEDDAYEKKYFVDGHEGLETSINAGYLYGGYNNNLIDIAKGKYDAIPDIFYFNCGGYSGKFVFDQKGKPQLIPQQDVVIETCKDESGSGKITGFIVIIPDGTKYIYNNIEVCYQGNASFQLYKENGVNDYLDYEEFGGPFFGAVSGPKYSVKLKPGDQIRQSPFNSSWFLTRIESVDGNSINFEYETEHQLVRNYGSAYYNTVRANTLFRSGYSTYYITNRLKRVYWKNYQIDLDYKIREDTEYDDNYHPHYNYALERLIVRNNFTKEEIKAYRFESSYFVSPDPDISGHTNKTKNNTYQELDMVLSKRLRLDSIVEYSGDKELPPYVFNYYNDELFPSRISDEQDMWGYYNDNNADGIIPTLYSYPDHPYGAGEYYVSPYSIFRRQSYTGREIQHPGADRLSNSSTIASLTLKSVQYPTGGQTRYEYEPHKFYVNGEENSGGGIRIARVIKSTDNTIGNKDDLKYEYNYHSSGRVVSLPKFWGNRSDYREDITVIYSNANGGISSSGGSFVTYGRVSEIVDGEETENIHDHSAMMGVESCDYSSENGENIYVRPNGMTGEGEYWCRQSGVAGVVHNIKHWDIYPNPILPNYDWKRKLIKERNYYSNKNGVRSLVKREQFRYEIKDYKKIPHKEIYLDQKLGSYGVEPLTCEQTDLLFYNNGYTISPWIVLTESRETEYDSSGESIPKSKSYSYGNGLNHKSPVEITEDKDYKDKLVKRLLYSYDFKEMPYDNKEGVSALVKENILIPVEISEYVIKDSKEYFTGASHTVYDYRNGIPVPVKEYKIETKNMLTDFSPCIRLFDGKEVIYYEKDDSYIEKFLYTRYDDKGNVLEMKDKASGLTICYIWGYNFEQPIAKVVNASYSDIEDVIGSDMTMLNYGYKFVGETPLELTDNDVCKMLDILRYKLPEAHVTTYTYKPLVGMTSETDVNGVTIYYEYDNFNRLKCIKNHDGNILKYYEYNHLNSKSDVNYIKENNRNKVQCKVSGGKGSVYPDWQFNIIKGTNKVIDLKPAEGMEVKDIIINGMSVKDAEFNDKINPIGKITQYTLKNITADTEVEVMFSKKRYGIYLSDNIDNLPLPDQVIDAFVEHGGNYSVNFPLSERGIPFKELQINGVVVGNSPNYTITDITEDKRVKAIYKGEEPQSGLITDDSGNPVLGVKVEVCLDSYGNLDVLETVTTGADGRFKLSKFYYSEQNPQNPERFAIRVSHSGYTFSTPIKVLNGVGDYDYTATKN